jgi:AcrR family transcriptional regulator
MDAKGNTETYRGRGRRDICGRMTGVEGSQDWVEAGFDALAEGGIDRVRIEVLAQALGVTKGGFYRRFRDRPALLAAMLEHWVDGRIAAIRQQTDLGGMTARERLRSIIRLFASRPNARGMAIEVAVRQWAQADAAAAAAVARVDAIRLERGAVRYGALGIPPDEAEARALMFYAFIFGQTLLFPNVSPAQRETMLVACADVLVEVGPLL